MPPTWCQLVPLARGPHPASMPLWSGLGAGTFRALWKPFWVLGRPFRALGGQFKVSEGPLERWESSLEHSEGPLKRQGAF